MELLRGATALIRHAHLLDSAVRGAVLHAIERGDALALVPVLRKHKQCAHLRPEFPH